MYIVKIEQLNVMAGKPGNYAGINSEIAKRVNAWHNRVRLSQCTNILDWFVNDDDVIIIEHANKFLVEQSGFYSTVYRDIKNKNSFYAEIPFMARIDINKVIQSMGYTLVSSKNLSSFLDSCTNNLIDTKPELITLDRFNNQLEVMPPASWKCGFNYEMFRLIELYSANIAIWYARNIKTGKCYTFKHDVSATDDELLKVLNNG